MPGWAGLVPDVALARVTRDQPTLASLNYVASC